MSYHNYSVLYFSSASDRVQTKNTLDLDHGGSVMKKHIKYILLIFVVALSAIIVVGIIAYQKNQDHIQGNFFRKMYGSIGVANKDEYAIQLNLFSFGQDILFLDDWKNLTFDNPQVQITNVSYEIQNQEADLTVYSVLLTINMEKTGQYEVTSLLYHGQDNQSTYPIGKIYFLYQEEASEFLKHGCNSYIENDEAVFTFLSDNQESFWITDVLLAQEDKTTYAFEKNVRYQSGEDLTYTISVNSSVSEYDLLVMQPIFELQYENTAAKKYFSPYMIVFRGKDMTYSEIKEYVK